MAKEEARWAKIKAAFIAGTPVNELAKRFDVPIAELLRRIKAEGWKREPPAAAAALPAVIEKPAPKSKAERVEEAAQDIIREHRDRVRTHREGFDALQAEFQVMTGHLISFLNEEQIAEIRASAAAERGTKLMAMLKAMAVKFGMFERLSNMLSTLIDMERTVWGLKETDEAPESVMWDDLLAKVREPSRPRPLPDNVVKFDRALAQPK